MKKRTSLSLVLAIVLLTFVGCQKKANLDTKHSAANSQKFKLPQQDNWYWSNGQEQLKQILNEQANTSQAKNIILFVADGLGVSTVTATRIWEGQQRGNSGEENLLFFENFPYSAMVKTYNTNQQVPDSAGTSTAFHSGVKTDAGVIGVDENVVRGDHSTVANNKVMSILQIAEQIGMSTGVISTARVTHATPAAGYAHSADRNWEDDKDIPEDQRKAGAKDIAAQLIDFPYGNGLEVAMGGGRRSFLPATVADPEDEGRTGERLDNRDLTKEWLKKYNNSAYVWNANQFNKIDAKKTDHLLGLFNRSHMQYEADREQDTGGEPSLSKMTQKAINILSKNPQGYYLMVESGRVDHANHATNAYRTVTDAVAFAQAVEAAYKMTNPKDTLIIVTADHSHVLTIAGYPKRGNPILGKVVSTKDELVLASDGKPYTTIGFMNGPSAAIDEARADLTDIDTEDPDFVQQALVPLRSETHSGEDIVVWATGPWAHLFQKTVEQSYIFHVMDYAADLRGRLKKIK